MSIFDFLSIWGNQTKIANKLDISPQAVRYWVTSKKIPDNRIVFLESESGIPRAEIRPELYV